MNDEMSDLRTRARGFVTSTPSGVERSVTINDDLADIFGGTHNDETAIRVAEYLVELSAITVEWARTPGKGGNPYVHPSMYLAEIVGDRWVSKIEGTTGLQRDVAIIRFAEDRGFFIGRENIFTVEYAGAVVDGNDDDEYFEHYDGDVEDEIRYCARDAIVYLNDHDLLPRGIN